MGIIIEWIIEGNSSIEYLDHIDPDNLDGLQEFNTTIEWGVHKKKWVKYNVGCQIERNGQGVDGGCIVVLTYNQQDNKHIPTEWGAGWGKNRIVIEPGQDRGVFEWAGDGEHGVWPGKPGKWKKKKLYEERNHRRSTQQIRDEKFRPQIIGLDGRCVISGETTEAALDAAHIIPAAKNGNEIPENGITLRADIHRQYDSGMFIIYPETGQTVIDPERRLELSEYYTELLDNSVLPPATRQRVSTALQAVWDALPPETRERVRGALQEVQGGD